MKRTNWQEFKEMLDKNGIKTLYHFTDRDNLEAIIKNNGLYSWKDCQDKGITIAKPGGGGPGSLSWALDSRLGLEHYVRVSFTRQHPMMYVAMNEGRISNPVILEIDPEVLYDEDVKYANMNATRTGANIGDTLDAFKAIHFDTVKARNHFDLDIDEQPFYQAEVLVKNFIPLSSIKNIGNFGIPIPSKPQIMESKNAYTARVDREHPTAFLFLVDHSASMRRKIRFKGDVISLSEVVSRIVNNQINELIEKCVKNNDTRHYYDIAVIGYGEKAYSAWNGCLEGKDFVTPEEIRNNPFKKITVKEEVRTKKGVSLKEVEKKQWLIARDDGKSTRMDKALERARELLDKWMQKHQNKDCFPPVVINVTDGAYWGVSDERMFQLSNELKSMFTNDGNVLFFNIHVSSEQEDSIVFPSDINELKSNKYGKNLFAMSSSLPLLYNQYIKDILGIDVNEDVRYRAMSVNAGMERLIKFIKIGTLSSSFVRNI